MPNSSSLTNAKWEILEPLLAQIWLAGWVYAFGEAKPYKRSNTWRNSVKTWSKTLSGF